MAKSLQISKSTDLFSRLFWLDNSNVEFDLADLRFSDKKTSYYFRHIEGINPYQMKAGQSGIEKNVNELVERLMRSIAAGKISDKLDQRKAEVKILNAEKMKLSDPHLKRLMEKLLNDFKRKISKWESEAFALKKQINLLGNNQKNKDLARNLFREFMGIKN